MSLRNKRDFREAVLQALDVNDDKDVENEYNFKSAVLEAMGVEFVPADIRDFEVFRAKLVEGIGNMSGGGGGSSDLSTATITLQNVGESTTRLSVSMGVCILENPSLMTGNYIDLMGDPVLGGSTVNQKVVLYHGEVNVRFNAEEIVSVDGNIVDIGNGQYKVTGDCSVIAKGSGSI